VAGRATDAAHKQNGPREPRSVGCVRSLGSKLVTGRDGREPYET